ncbi:MAG: RidA family protein [Siculibacillus sp.]|nr:RidA family protein [Siculibacillus sp.]
MTIHTQATPLDRLGALGLTLPPPPEPVADYVPYAIHGDLLYLSGQGPRQHDGILRVGTVGRDVDVAAARADAELTGLNLLAVAQAALGDLGRVKRVLKLFGMVNAVPDFAEHPKVIDGCSSLFVAVFGEAGRHARSAVGLGSLPDGITVEIEAIFAIGDRA